MFASENAKCSNRYPRAYVQVQTRVMVHPTHFVRSTGEKCHEIGQVDQAIAEVGWSLAQSRTVYSTVWHQAAKTQDAQKITVARLP